MEQDNKPVVERSSGNNSELQSFAEQLMTLEVKVNALNGDKLNELEGKVNGLEVMVMT